MNRERISELAQQALRECSFEKVRHSIVSNELFAGSTVEIPMVFAERFAELVLENQEQVNPSLGSDLTIHSIRPKVDPVTFLPSLDITATWDLVDLMPLDPDEVDRIIGKTWTNALTLYRAKEKK
jgi:hypothetical protein